MRVLAFVGEYQRFAGSQRSLLHALCALREESVKITVAFPHEGGCPDQFRRAGMDVVVVPTPVPLLLFGGAIDRAPLWSQAWRVLRYGLGYWAGLARSIRHQAIDVVHCNSHRSVLLAGVGARLAGRPVIWHLRGRLHPNRLLRWVAERLSTRIIVVSPTLAEEVSPGARRRVVVIPNAVDDTSLPDLGAETGETPLVRAPGTAAVGVLASLVPYKGIHHAIGALVRVRDRGLVQPTPFLLIAGESPDDVYRRYVEDLVSRHGLETVRFAGFVENPRAVYEAVDVVLLTSVERETLRYPEGEVTVRGTEGLPRTVLEAMYVGTPVVATDVAGVRDQIVDGTTGLLVPPGDEDALAEAIAQVVNDDRLRARLIEQAGSHVRQRFSTPAMVGRVLEIYAELAPAPAASRALTLRRQALRRRSGAGR